MALDADRVRAVVRAVVARFCGDLVADRVHAWRFGGDAFAAVSE